MLALKCLVPCERSNYAATPGIDVVVNQLDGGAGRYRQDQLGVTAQVSVQWSVGSKDYDYLMAFYRQNKAIQFTIDLILDSSIAVEYTANFVPGTFTLSSQSGLTYVLQATLEVQPLPVDNIGDAEILGRNS
jgi:hypothetical protein